MADIYALTTAVDAATVDRFRRQYLGELAPPDGPFWWPTAAEGADLQFRGATLDELLAFLVARPGRDYVLYFHAAGPGPVRLGMLFFNPDATLTMGVGVAEEQADAYRCRLSADFPGALLLRCDDVPPPDTAAEFREWMLEQV